MISCEAEGVRKNLRYRFLFIKDNIYILDVDKPYLVFLFPFVYWLFPHTIHKIDEDLYEQLKVHKVEKVKAGPI